MLKMKYYTVEERNILHTIKRRRTNWIGHILRRNFFYNMLLKKRWKEGNVSGGRGRRRKLLLDEL